MASWLPRNFHKRVFKYLLDQLAVFSSVDVDQLNVSLGTTSSLTLTDVDLDLDRLRVPGLYVRSGTISTLTISLGVLGQVNVRGSGLSLTVSLSAAAAASYKPGDLSGALSKTTADLASSVLSREELEAQVASENDAERGYGLGDFGPVVASVVDSALSQLDVSVDDVTIRVILDDTCVVDVKVAELRFSTDDKTRRRHLELVGLEIGRVVESNEPESDHESASSSDMEESMMQSTMFSHEEASSMYMSALSQVLQPQAVETLERALTCDRAALSFRHSLNLDDVEIELGSLVVDLDRGPELLVAFLRDVPLFMQDSDANKVMDTKTNESESLVKRVLIRQLDFRKLPGLSLVLQEINVTLNSSDQRVSIQRIFGMLGSSRFFSFDDNPEMADFMLKLAPSEMLLLVPKPGLLKAGLPELALLLEVYHSLHGVLDGLIGNSKKPGPGKNPKKLKTVLQTNHFSVAIKAGGSTVNITALPSGIDDHGDIRLGRIFVKLRTGGRDQSIDLAKGLVQVSESGLVSADLDLVKLDLDEAALRAFAQDLAKAQVELARRPSVQHKQVFERIRPVRVGFDQSQPDTEVLRIKIKCISTAITSDALGTLQLDLKRVGLHLRQGQHTVVSIEDVHLHRDFSDLDPTVGQISLIHAASPDLTGPQIVVDVIQGHVKEVLVNNLAVEYHLRLLTLVEKMTTQDSQPTQVSPLPDLTESTATIKDQKDQDQDQDQDQTHISIMVTNCIIGLSPNGLASKAQVLVRSCSSSFRTSAQSWALELLVRVGEVVLIDDVAKLDPGRSGSLVNQGYVHVATASSLSVSVKCEASKMIDVQLSSELVTLMTCADSTHTLIQTLNGLKPIMADLSETKYQTVVHADADNVLADIDDRAFNEDAVHRHKDSIDSISADMVSDDVPSNLDFVESYYADQASRAQWTSSMSSSGSASRSGGAEYSRADLLLDQDLNTLANRPETGQDNGRRMAIFEQRARGHESSLDVVEDHFSGLHLGTSRPELSPSWSPESPASEVISEPGLTSTPEPKPPSIPADIEPSPSQPIRIHLADTRVTWNLHDGYDWSYTQDAIAGAVTKVEVQADQALREGAQQPADDSEVVPLIGDILFNSIYVGIPQGRDPGDLRREINRHLMQGDDQSEASAETDFSRAGDGSRPKDKTKKSRLRLKRSKQHKLRIELYGVSVRAAVFLSVEEPCADGTLLNRVELKVRDAEVLDNLASSTWNKFLTYMKAAGEREHGACMVSAVMDTVKPVGHIASSEVVIDVVVLPLRLHVDQDTLDFATRFFEFKDDRVAPSAAMVPEEEVFVQRFSVAPVQLRLDYKPKTVDYAGLQSGHMTEFMNFFTLDEADMVLRRVVLHGVPGFARLAQELQGIWIPDIRSTQLGGVLAGIAPVRSLIRLGSGLRQLVVIPVQEYQRDGRIVRSIHAGALQFARSTTHELVKLGAKLAAGTQTILESAEHTMAGTGKRHVSPYDDEALESDDRATSHYANQPPDINQGLQAAYTSFGRNLARAKDAIADIGPDSAERGGNAHDAAAAVLKAAPVAVMRPMIGAAEAVSKTLFGLTNQLEPEQLEQARDKYRE